MLDSDSEVDEFLHRVSEKRVDPGEVFPDISERKFDVEEVDDQARQSKSRTKQHARSFSDRDHEDSLECQVRRHRSRDNSEYFLVQRPLPFRATGVTFDPSEGSYRLFGTDNGWCARILERYADAGYGPRTDSLGGADAVARVFRELPPDLAEVLKEGLHSLQVLSAAQSAARAREGIAVNDAMDPSAAESARMLADIEDNMWEMNTECGYLRFEWDPVTERRRFTFPP